MILCPKTRWAYGWNSAGGEETRRRRRSWLRSFAFLEPANSSGPQNSTFLKWYFFDDGTMKPLRYPV